MSDGWASCRAYLEAHCEPSKGPMAETSVRYAHVLWLLADCIQARTILEIGIGPTAVSGSTFIHNLASRGGGTLHSIDIAPDRPRACDRQLAKEKGVLWAVLHGDSLHLAPYLPKGLQVDLLYIDGDHDHAHAYGDTTAYLPFLRPGGYLVIDDCPTFEGVVSAKLQLEAEGLRFVHLAHETPHGNGRLLWQKGAMDEYLLRERREAVWQ